jgi:hypothetical protein
MIPSPTEVEETLNAPELSSDVAVRWRHWGRKVARVAENRHFEISGSLQMLIHPATRYPIQVANGLRFFFSNTARELGTDDREFNLRLA